MTSSPKRTIALLALVTFFTFLVAQTASAHDVLITSSPAEGEHVEFSPKELKLEFNNELLDLGSGATSVILSDAANREVATLPLALQGRYAIAELPNLKDGNYRAAWSVVSSDGHRIQGVLNFTVGEAVSEPSTSAEPDTEAGPTTDAAQDTAAKSSFPRIALLAIAAGIIVAMALIVFKLKRK